jgi:glycosyltransferase involved in cell wall biosynthesis
MEAVPPPTSTLNDIPQVSVVVPAFNTARYIGRALRSVLAQRAPAHEIIVVDDGSWDDTAAVVQGFGSVVRLIRQANGGASAARNTGILAARGTHIAFLDSDDYWLDTKLEAQLAVLAEHPSLVLISTRWRWLPSATNADRTDFAGPAYEAERLRLLSGWEALLPDPYLGTPTVLVRRDRALTVGGFDRSLPSAEDVDFFLRVIDGAPYALIDQPLVAFQIRTGSLTRTERGSFYNLQVLERFASTRPDLMTKHEALLRQCQLAIYGRWIRTLLFRGQGAQARQLLRESRRAGTLPGRLTLCGKSWIAAPQAWLRQRFRPMAQEAVAHNE